MTTATLPRKENESQPYEDKDPSVIWLVIDYREINLRACCTWLSYQDKKIYT